MRYPVNLKKDGKFFLATFPDIPDAITQERPGRKRYKRRKKLSKLP
jgi:hypothetical protein